MREPDESTPAERARAGVRAWIREAGRHTGGGVRGAGPYAILASLTAAVLAPLDDAGGAILAEVMAGTGERRRSGGPAGEQPWRDAVAAGLLHRLAAGDDRGRRLHEEISRVLREVDAIGTAISEAAVTDDELRRALEAAFQELGLGVGELGWMVDDLRRSVDDLHRQLAARSVRLHRELAEARRHLVAVTRERLPAEDGVPAGTPAGAVPPYPGLASFQPEDAPWFRGREQQVAELLGQLAEQAAGGPPLVVTGASGVGKSSLVRAGLLPGIAAGALGERAAAWPWVLTTPGDHPLDHLRARLRRLAGDSVPEPGAGRHSPVPAGTGAPESLAELAAVPAAAGLRPVIVVDQFEELFTQCTDPAERLAYAAALTGAAPSLVVIAVRSDFYAACAGLPPLADALAGGHVVLGPPDAPAIRRAVVEPAERAGLGVEPVLPDLILDDLGADRPGGYDPADLPLLAHALRATWDRREGARLTVAAYRATGGIRHAIAGTAERIFGDLPPEDGERLRLALLTLVSVTADGTVTLRRGDRVAADSRVLRRLVKARLVTVGAETVEISHEALLTGWPRLAGWVAEVRDDLLARQQISGAAREWDSAGRDPRLLPRGSRLLAARERASGAEEEVVDDYLTAAEQEETSRRAWWRR